MPCLCTREPYRKETARLVDLSLLPLLNIAGSKAALNTGSNISRDLALVLVNVSAVDGVSAEGASKDITAEVEVGLSNLLDTGVFTGEASNEGRVGAKRVELGVHSTLGEDSHLVLSKVVDNSIKSVLKCELGNKSTFNNDIDLGRARVDVRSVEAAGAKEAKSHGNTGTCQGRKRFAVSLYGVTTTTDSVGAISLGLAEVIDLVGRSEKL